MTNLYMKRERLVRNSSFPHTIVTMAEDVKYLVEQTQGGFGNVVAGSLFATLQSAGAGGNSSCEWRGFRLQERITASLIEP